MAGGKFSRTHDAVTYVLLAVAALIILLPISGVLLAALHKPGSLVAPFTFPESLSLETFTFAWQQGRFSSYVETSTIVTASVTLFVVVLSTMAGYSFAKISFSGSDALFYFVALGIVIPSEATIVPLYYEFRSLGLLNSHMSIILPQIAHLLPFGVLWMRAAFQSMPDYLSDSARVDGASSWKVLWQILVPNARPAVLTLTVIIAMWSWNDFFLPLVMASDVSLRTAPVGLSFFQGEYQTDVPALAAAAVIVALPIIVLFVFLQRHFIQGILSGGSVE